MSCMDNQYTMDFSQTFTELPPFGRLHFQDDSDEEMEIDIADMLTPSRTSDNKQFLSLLMDEDSGLGMDRYDKDNVSLEFSSHGLKNTPKFSLQQNVSIPNSGNAKRSLFGKRLADQENGSYCKIKAEKQTVQRRKQFRKALSFGDSTPGKSEETEVKTAVARLADEENLIGDGSQECTLPTFKGSHSDLKTISAESVADLLSGRYHDVISTFRIIDCRYPYEYEGGHVMTAENIYKQEDVSRILESVATDGKRPVLIFYCEFSSERGPKMYRKLRSADREINKENYPHLICPEIYLMHGGYKTFFQHHKNLCTPQDYTPMLHKDHSNDLRHFRAKSKSWAGNEKRSGSQRLLF